MSHRVRFASRAERYLGRLDRRTQERIRDTVEALAENPRHPSTKQLAGGTGLRAARCGDYRILYSVFDDENLVIIERIAPRGQVYRNL